MDFADLCDSKLLARVGQGNVRKNNMGEWCFSLAQLQLLPEIIFDEVDAIDDLVVETYYMPDNRIMEAYWYNLSIRVVDGEPNREMFFLSVTGKERIEEIDTKVLFLLENTYYEVRMGDKHEFVECLKRWLKYMAQEESKLTQDERSREIYGEIADDGIYYALL